MEYYWEIIAALKVRTSNKKGRHLSPGEAIRLFERFGVEIPDLLIKAQKSMFKTNSVNRYLRHWGYDHETLHRQSAAVRFVAGIRFVTPGGQQTSRFTWENDGRLEHAHQTAGHESPRTMKLYDRTKDEITLSEVERIRL